MRANALAFSGKTLKTFCLAVLLRKTDNGAREISTFGPNWVPRRSRTAAHLPKVLSPGTLLTILVSRAGVLQSSTSYRHRNKPSHFPRVRLSRPGATWLPATRCTRKTNLALFLGARWWHRATPRPPHRTSPTPCWHSPRWAPATATVRPLGPRWTRASSTSINLSRPNRPRSNDKQAVDSELQDV